MLPRGYKSDVERKRTDSLPSVVEYAFARVGRDLGCKIRARGILDPNGWVLVEIDGARGKILIGNDTLDDYYEAPSQREEDDRKAEILRRVRQQVERLLE